MGHLSYKEHSKRNWGVSESSNLSLEQINTGAILRIADATELMAKDRLRMENDLAWYKKRYDELRAENKRLANRINGFQGYIKRIKRK